MNDTQQIRNDIAHCKRRIAEMESGTRGQIPSEAMHMNAGAAFDNQLRNLYATVDRLELEYVQAKLGRGWGAGEIIRRMEMRSPEVTDDEEIPCTRADTSARIGSDASQDTGKA